MFHSDQLNYDVNVYKAPGDRFVASTDGPGYFHFDPVNLDSFGVLKFSDDLARATV